jgi:hypothetical protein
VAFVAVTAACLAIHGTTRGLLAAVGAGVAVVAAYPLYYLVTLGRMSPLIDAGEWLWVAEGHARGVPAGAEGLPDADRRRCRLRLAAAVAALDEVLKFVPPGGARVPFTAVWTTLGRSVYQREPGRFRTGRLAAVRTAYDGALRRLG